mmetsp:Transcript_947/g.3344  ORF Transcript_947/g.3344 Transcript_947/m.3344 type:complete len:250 (-) Transcript_947:67-816(-)
MVQVRALFLACSAGLASSARDGLDDALVAWQTRVDVDKFDVDWPNKNEKRIWGPVIISDLSFMNPLDKGIMSTYRDQQVMSMRKSSSKARAENKLSVEWKFMHTEPGSKMTVAFQKGCDTGSDGIKNCNTDFSQLAEASRLNLALAYPIMDERTKVTFDWKVNAGFIHHSQAVTCSACGAPCTGSIMGRKFSIEMPACPIPVATWVFTLPVPQVTNTPDVPDFNMFLHGTVMRPGNFKAAEFQAKISAV